VRHQYGTRALLAGLAFGLWLATAPTTAAADADADAEALEVAVRFGRLVMEGRFEEAQPLMDEAMVGAFDRATFERVRGTLEQQLGELRELGEPWQEDVVQGHRRMRVPVSFASGRADLRIVLDAAGRVAGFTVVPYSPRPEDDPPAGREIEVRIGSGEDALGGLLELPEGAGPHPAVVLVHGSGASNRDEAIGPNRPFRDLSRGLAARGVAVLRYDKRSFARPESLLAVGDGLTVRDEVIDDARAALALLRAHEGIDGSRLFVVGHSFGGTLAPRIAAEEPRPAGLVILAGMTLPFGTKMIKQTRYIAELDGSIDEAEQQQLDELERQVHVLEEALAGRRQPPAGYVLGAPFGYHADLAAHDPPAEAAQLGLPVLVLQGRRDYQVTQQDFARWQAALEGKPFACLEVYDGLDHLFRRGSGPSSPADYDLALPVDTQVIDDIAAWIRTGRCPAPAQDGD
jgi:hypothetical protein